MKRKLLSLLLCAATAMGSVALLASCAEGETTATTTGGGVANNPGGDSEERFLEKLPADLNFANEGLDEEDLTLYVAYSEGNNGAFTQRSLKADPMDESVVDQKTYERDDRMKAQLGLELVIEQTGTGIADMESTIGTQLQAGTPDYDILAAYQYYGISMATKGYLLNLANLAQDDADYIDFEADYWGKAYNDNMSYQGAYYWITGDIALRYIGGMYCTFVNSALYRDYLEADYGSIYTIARDGKWTMDMLIEMSSKIYEDVGTTVNEPDSEDIFGFGYETNDPIDGIAIGCGVQFTYKDPTTGEVQLTFNNQHSFDISDKINKLATQSTSFKYDDYDSTNVMPAFANGTVAFHVNKLFQAEAYLDGFEDFYIIPAPKYDENQTNYITGLHDGCTIFGITWCTPKVRQAAAALEFLCAYSSRDVMPQYYEGALKKQFTRDAEAPEMIDLIHSNITTDFAVAWGGSIDNIVHIFRQCQKITNGTIKRDINGWKEQIAELGESLLKHKDGGAVEE
ncbi:MAG: hypothetical protein IJX47_06985 [Clostridia bacterium]|nr:hypothetical protein [Clostridia bacterium]MBQ8382928.1 hypothetical protein [Clostridia bacterium]